MPELPEVEIAARNLRRWLIGRTILSVSAKAGTPLRNLTPSQMRRGLTTREVLDVRRRGKQLFLDLDSGDILLAHLGMTGKFVLIESKEKRPGERIRVSLSDGSTIAFIDPRRFGRVRLLPGDEAMAHPEIAALGPDALEVLRARRGLEDRAGTSRSAIKLVLMDQKKLAGIGNIHASEGLFNAKISPFVRAADLTGGQWSRLSRGLLKSLESTLTGEDGDEIHYLGESGAENRFRVYGRAGERCPRRGCHGSIERAVQGARSTFFCPKCQTGAKHVR